MIIAAVIVTFDRLSLLKDALDAVINQTRKLDLIIIVDNNSTDGTRQWLLGLAESRSDIVLVLLDKNFGGAGGFHYGIKKAFELGADWIWTMDDDSLPEPYALERLIDCGIINAGKDVRNVGFLASRVNWKDGTPHLMNVPGPFRADASGQEPLQGLTRISYASFVSILLNRFAIAQAGLPIKEFFIYCDDVEYTRRTVSYTHLTLPMNREV